jgi:hypothetical protein
VNTDELAAVTDVACRRVPEIQAKLHRRHHRRDLWRARCRDDWHAGFGRRLGETHRSKYRQGAPSRPHTATTCLAPLRVPA